MTNRLPPEANGARPLVNRRHFLAAAGSVVAWAHMPHFARAAGRDPRFIVVVLRGGMDGLAAVPPVGDPDYAAVRGEVASATEGGSALPLEGIFALNAAMPKLHQRYRAGELLVVQAVASPYRERSHFDAQDVLESGLPVPRAGKTGWLNRAVEALPKGERVSSQGGLATMPTVPLILRGSAPVLTWVPPDLAPASSDTVVRLIDLYQHTDPEMARVFGAGHDLDLMGSGSKNEPRPRGIDGAFEQLARGAGRLLARDDGPRIAVISYDGWDTHARQGTKEGRLARLLGALDGALDALRLELGSNWSQTVVAVVTEFGRTAHQNGTQGTDHGTATSAFVVGGAVKGGRVIADWPGLKTRNLYEGRDLAPTTDLRAVFKALLQDHLGLSERVLADAVFPDTQRIRPLSGLVV
jgi:uncharacterized protein (DUF1501 family)